MLESSTGKKALNKALILLGKRAYTIKQIRQKLQKKNYSNEIIEAVVKYCLEMGYLNDQEYVRQWISTHNRIKPIGRKRILYELKSKGIDKEIILACLNDSFTNELEYQLAFSLIKKKIGHNLEIDDDSFKKLYRFLLRRGFSHSIAIKVLNNYDLEWHDSSSG
ncbi:MAG: regulatory protein RecX [Zhaonellaceae bacterium]|nr:regulatory protein RecX [Clostridia bacterium]